MFIKKLVFLCFMGIFIAQSDPAWAQNIPSSRRAKRAIQKTTPVLETELNNKNLELGAPLFLRIIKSPHPQPGKLKDGVLEVFIEDKFGQYTPFKSYPICAASGFQGPKKKTGDYQSPEGFYFINARRFNPKSSYHLSLNMGYPNAYDQAQGYTGSYLMIHGECVSIGCYAMTNKGINEIYSLANAAIKNGQSVIRVHSFPFPMTSENIETVKTSQHYKFWKNLKQGWDWFEARKIPPDVQVRQKTYTFHPLPSSP